MEDKNDRELTEEELSQYLGGASIEAAALKLGIAPERYRELLQKTASDPKIMRALLNHDPNYTVKDDKIDSDHKMGGK